MSWPVAVTIIFVGFAIAFVFLAVTNLATQACYP